MSVIDLTFVTLFDMGTDKTAHAFPIHHRMKSLLQTCVSGMLQIVVVPFYCRMLEVFWDDKFAIFAKDLNVFN